MHFLGRVSVAVLFGLVAGCSSAADEKEAEGGSSGADGVAGRGGRSQTAGGHDAAGPARNGGTAGAPTPGESGSGAADGGTTDDSGTDARTADGAAGTGGTAGPVNPDAAVAGKGGVPDSNPAGTVPMFVVSGQMGRTVTSCDDGRTWRANDFTGPSRDELNEKGIAFGHGVFMRVLGWGAQCSFMRSDDGVTWRRITLAQAGLPSMSECGGITYNGDGFTMVHWGGAAYASDHDGLQWKRIGMFSNRNEHVREVVGDGPAPGIILAGGANDPSGTPKNPPHVSVDGGKTWKATPGCSTFNAIAIGQQGGGALGGGRMVFVGFKGQVCTSSDMVTWQEAQIPAVAGNVQGKLAYDGELFWLADGSRLLVSANGLAWTERKLPANVRIHAVAKSSSGTLVGFNRDSSAFYRSTDGTSWSAAVGPGDGPELYRVVFGHGKPSASCPLR